MAAAYAEPSPNLCAHVLLLSGCSVLLLRCRTSSQLCVLKSPARPPQMGVGDGAWMAGECQHSCLLSDTAQGPGRRYTYGRGGMSPPLPHQWKISQPKVPVHAT